MGCIRVGGFLALAIASALALTTAVPAPASAANGTIVFGAALAATGSTAREGELTKEGYDFWKDYVNAHGGMKVAGKTYNVDIKYYDDESNPQTAARLIEKLVSEDHVSFILGPYGSANSATAEATSADRASPASAAASVARSPCDRRLRASSSRRSLGRPKRRRGSRRKRLTMRIKIAPVQGTIF